MYPYLNLFGRVIPLYGVMTALGAVLAVIYIKLREKNAGELARELELAFIYSALSAAVGAKLVYLAENIRPLAEDWRLLWQNTDAFLQKYLYGGFVFYGGLFGAMAALALYCRVNRLKYSDMANIFIPTLPLIHAFGRLGCFCMGCCYGTEAAPGAPHVVFHLSQIAPNGVALVPVQLYETGAELLLFALLAIFARRGNARLRDGLAMNGIYLVAYAVLRFTLEFWRGDEYRGFIGALSVSQWLSAAALAAGVAMLLISRKRLKTNSSE